MYRCTVAIMAWAVFILGMCLFTPVFAIHGQVPQWVDESKDQNGDACCGKDDCIPVASIHILAQTHDLTVVSIEGIVGSIYNYTLVPVCPIVKPQLFICVYTTEMINAVHSMCLLKNIDGTIKELRVTPNCIRCLLTIECSHNSS